MHPISRRLFLAGSVAVVVGACSDATTSGSTTPRPENTVAATTPPSSSTAPTPTSSTVPTPRLPGDPFTLGVASGDPDPTSVVLWTRLAPDPLAGGGMPDANVPVTWQASSDDTFATVAHSGSTVATTAHGHSVHALAELPSGTWYYRFSADGFVSPTGITHVAPAQDTPTASVRFATASCQHYETGFYRAHADIADQQPDFLVWLGDYIYEGGGGSVGKDGRVRSHVTAEPTTLADYRNRYALYKSDPDLQAAHAVCPWFVIWDDHEVENNYAGLSPQNPADAAGFAERRYEAYQAWWEHMPVRLEPPAAADADYVIYRAVQWGDLLGITLLDTRQYRTDQACNDVTLSTEPPCDELFEEGRTLTGDRQEQFLYDTIGNQQTVWNVIGQQVVMTDLTFNGAVLNFDQWDGYPANRKRILAHLAEQAIPNVVVLTGDIHLAGVGQLHSDDPGSSAPVGVEFVATSISSSGNIPASLTELVKSFPDVIDAELVHRGYILHTVTPAAWSAEYRIVDDARFPDSAVSAYRTFVIDTGTNTVRKEQP